MSTYFIGDIHGCYTTLKLLLQKVCFNSQKDFLWVAGDLVSRGPNSLEVLRYLYSLKNRVKIVLGNHDLNLLAVYSGIRKNKEEYYFDDIFSAKDNKTLINWLRNQPILQVDPLRKIIMSHAGISPYWNIRTTIFCAKEIESHLSREDYPLFLQSMYGNNINIWNWNLSKLDRLKYSINVFTRMRYCYKNGQINLFCKSSPIFVHKNLQPWFLMKRKISQEYSIFFGHWSSLKGINVSPPFFPLDTGCCWGNELTIIRWEDKKRFFQVNASS